MSNKKELIPKYPTEYKGTQHHLYKEGNFKLPTRKQINYQALYRAKNKESIKQKKAERKELSNFEKENVFENSFVFNNTQVTYDSLTTRMLSGEILFRERKNSKKLISVRYLKHIGKYVVNAGNFNTSVYFLKPVPALKLFFETHINYY